MAHREPTSVAHHTTEGPSAAAAAAPFAAYAATRNIPHFTVDDMTIYQCVDTGRSLPGTTEAQRWRGSRRSCGLPRAISFSMPQGVTNTSISTPPCRRRSRQRRVRLADGDTVSAEIIDAQLSGNSHASTRPGSVGLRR
jgi:hypothetical protein